MAVHPFPHLLGLDPMPIASVIGLIPCATDTVAVVYSTDYIRKFLVNGFLSRLFLLSCIHNEQKNLSRLGA